MPIDTGIPTKQRATIAAGLSRLLADTYVLYLKTHSFHWNVEGPMFQTLHQMFMDQYTETWNAIDPIAERIRALGHYAPGSYKQYVKLASVKESEGVPKAGKMVRELIEGQEAVARTARSVLPLADGANDQPTLDLLTQRLDIHEKNAWMLRSLLKK
jgi:starvation-inducible DNA-binding protein